MTKIQTTYKLSRALGDDDLTAISRVHSVYGILKARIAGPALDQLEVEYDATRLYPADLREMLERHGIPILA
jgi:hypothetical protein